MKNVLFALLICLFLIENSTFGTISEYATTEKIIDDSELNSPLLDISAVPSSIIGGAVNVITGNFVEGCCDLNMSGANSLSIQRHFNSGSREKGGLCHGWDLNFPSNIVIWKQGNKNYASVRDRGAQLRFNANTSKEKMKVSKHLLKYGVTNCSGGVLSSQNNIKNKRLYYREEARHCELWSESGEILLYKRTSNRDDGVKYAISDILLPNGCSLSYEYSKRDQISQVTAKGAQGDVLGCIKWDFSKGVSGHRHLSLESSDGRKNLYDFAPKRGLGKGDVRYCLKSVTRDHAPDITYSYYKPANNLVERLKKKMLPDNRYLEIRYYEKGANQVGEEEIDLKKNDARIGRVSALYSPVGSDGSSVMTHKLKYFLNRRRQSSKPIGGRTEVTDALGHCKVYHFSDEQRLTDIDHLLDSGELYRQEKMVWGEHGEEKTFLLARGVTDKHHHVVARTNYSYNKQGNVLEEALLGNLTGQPRKQGNTLLAFDKFTKTYTYTGSGLLASETEGRKRTVFKYVKGRDLIGLKLIYGDGQICERYQYVYDDNSVLIEESVDDGISIDFNCLEGVSERRIKKVHPTKENPIGLPEIIEEKYLNLATGQEELLQRIENYYSLEGQLLQQKVYDKDQHYQYCKEWGYDAHGNVTLEIDSLGQTTEYQYDKNNNCTFKQTPNQEYYTRYKYDFANRLIQKKDVYKNRLILKNSYAYDQMGNKISSTDEFGNTTKHIYDEFGRLVEKIYPETINIRGELESQVDKVSYDCLDNPSKKTDSNHQTIKSKYTARGKPHEIEHPDGAIEKRTYHLDGSLIKIVDSKGLETHYTNDHQGRITCEEKRSLQGAVLSIHSWIYNQFHLLEEIDPEGHKTTYSYDCAGRQIAVIKENAETKFVYDSMGRQSEVWEMYEAGKFRKTLYEFDCLNRIIGESILDESEKISMQKSYRFDSSGNRTHEIIHTDEGAACTETQYNAYNKPVKIIHPNGSETTIEYRYDYKNDRMQGVAYIEEVDPRGIQTIKIMDARGRLAKEIVKDSTGEKLQCTLYYYDGEGNLLKRTDQLIIDGVKRQSIHLAYQYDSCNREIAVIEAAGTPLEKMTKKEYHPGGVLAVINKPNGVKLFHEHDLLGRLIDIQSSDRTIHYAYTYDNNNNVLKVEDCLLKLETERVYDENNRMIFERSATGLEVSYQFDALGRIKQVFWPDYSSIDYVYGAVHIKSAERIKNEKSLVSTYSFNQAGKVSKVEMCNHAVTVDYTYDECLRPKKIESQNFLQVIPNEGYDPAGNITRLIQKDMMGEFVSNFAYDGLNHLISENGIAVHSYRFDSIHNRIKKNEAQNSVNALNQLINDGKDHLSYDLNGNQIQKTDDAAHWEYQYDALDRLTAVICGNSKTEYLYDAFHRRLKKSFFIQHEEGWLEIDALYFLYQGEKEVGALNKDRQMIEMRTLGLGINGEIGAAMLFEIGNQDYVPLHDFRGNVVALINMDDREAIECYRYTAYGEEQLYGAGTRLQKALSPWRFCSKRVDPETGWLFYGRRYYDAETGRWTTPDPLGFKDGRNTYCFVHNRPMVFIDPDGRFFTEIFNGFLEYIGDEYENMANIAKNYQRSPFSENFNRGRVQTQEYRVGSIQDDKLKFTFINGILNDLTSAKASAKMFSDMAGGREVIGIHNPSFDFLDIGECVLNLFGIQTPPSKLLADKWTEILKDPKIHILHGAHSQGMLHTRLAMRSLSPELRSRITVIGVAPAGFMNEAECCSATHFVSEADFVPSFDRGLQWLLRNNRLAPVVTLPRHPEAYFFDHVFNSPTYREPLEKETQFFINQYSN